MKLVWRSRVELHLAGWGGFGVFGLHALQPGSGESQSPRTATYKTIALSSYT